MKIYDWPNDKNKDWPTEYVWLDEDHVLDSYKPEEYDKNLSEYLCKVHWGEYMRVAFQRRYKMAYVEVNSLEELWKYCKDEYEKFKYFDIGWRDGVMQFNPWTE
ncbi:MAG: hypothetical protein ACXADY_18325 [Candidatus Hodarchaeales archaeon]|jgi:hypothetical protein